MFKCNVCGRTFKNKEAIFDRNEWKDFAPCGHEINWGIIKRVDACEMCKEAEAERLSSFCTDCNEEIDSFIGNMCKLFAKNQHVGSADRAREILFERIAEL